MSRHDKAGDYVKLRKRYVTLPYLTLPYLTLSYLTLSGRRVTA